MLLGKKRALAFSILFTTFSSHADTFPKLNQSLPSGIDAREIAPVFDFDSDGCFPSAGVSRSGVQNGGLKPSGNITGGCRWSNFLDSSNTLHRYACVNSSGARYCGSFYSLYFLKDQILNGVNSGHRHDWEHVAIWTKNGVVTHGSYSAHGKLTTKDAASIDKQDGHLKFVYHKDGALTHAFRFSKTNENAENPYKKFVTPDIISWYTMFGDGINNQELRNRLNAFDYGSASIPLKDNNFLTNLNNGRPAGYPEFTAASLTTSK
ncbi:NPP1 family protein [Pectobacterium parmentieri]|uniref:Sugar-binding protein n=1 Tax=Pectobacterium parmentieri TaxID=1905730 RepID=A0A8B3FAF5_PECPM|nr:NPP1 family protein [Pectobacterium parmentieri]AOR59565.1 sugar-binding protein [Pectobacterium parmentieri]AYH09464.1 sugar-binding protein [Pectobacterium parmentieri]AYH19826.1 sugar-binding protein [Pectobacterium parmentieri]AYH35778.1 sugar-binding protein [Pectobacterium parmentieri]AZS55845.1 sugar-binding protein [Pectobacterium parmentieri]